MIYKYIVKYTLTHFVENTCTLANFPFISDRNEDTPEDVINSAISTARIYKDGSGIEISELDRQRDNNLKNVWSSSYKTKTDDLQTGNRRNPPSYHRREKRSPQPLSNLIWNTNVHVVRNESEEYYFVDILKAIAKANDLTYIQLFNKIESFVDDKENSRATLSAEWNSGYIGNVTVNYYY